MRTLELASDGMRARIDPGRGADMLSLVDKRTGTDVLFRTPWREHADAIREGQAPSTFDPVAGWMEQYRGGWQTLCPNAGDPRLVHDAPVAFHGEASVTSWTVDEARVSEASLHVELFSIPIRIDRTIVLDNVELRLVDTLTNLSVVPLEFDYSNHPAFGGAFLDGECRFDTGARRFTSDPDSITIIDAGSTHKWPWATSRTGERIDLRHIPGPGQPRELLGWLDDFLAPWASIRNVELGLTVRIEWDDAHLPYAWLWQELNATPSFPWYKRARAVAVEPASTQTSGPDRRSVLRLGPHESVRLPISISFEE